MVYNETRIHIVDNSGILIVKCIRILRGLKKCGRVGDFIIIVVPFRRRKRKYLTKNIYVALIVSQRGQTRRVRGIYIILLKTKAILLTDQARMVGTRIKGPVMRELRYYGLFKIVSKAKNFI